MRNSLNISFAGAGNVSEALCMAFYRSGYKIDLIVSETEASSMSLAHRCNASWSRELIFPDSTNLIIVAVPDQRLLSVLDKIKCNQNTLVVHTAGSVGIDIFPRQLRLKGIFYPLQTFSKNRQLDFNGLPFLIETHDNKSSEILKTLAESIGGKVYFVDSDHRRKLHLAAVFACNFTNHMLTVSKDLAVNAGVDFKVLESLIMETISKAIENGPEVSQTGPAVRNDQNTIKKHLELLSFSSELQQIYEEMSTAIIRYYNIKDKKV